MVPCGEDKGGGWLVDASSSSSGGNGSISAKFPGAVCFILIIVPAYTTLTNIIHPANTMRLRRRTFCICASILHAICNHLLSPHASTLPV